MAAGNEVHMSKLAYLTAAILVIPAPGFAQIVFQDSPPAVAPTKAAVPQSDLNKIECRTEETIGSRLQSRRVCLTKQQWFQEEQENKRKVQEIQDRAPGPASG
jgi:hypothetical protein